MRMVTVQDGDNKWMFDADMNIATADDGLAFYQSQLSVLDPKIYEAKYQGITYEGLIPVDTSDPEWVDSVDYISYDAVTAGKFIGANAKDLPESDINASKSTIKVFYGGNKYSYSLDELRKSQAMQMPVDVTKATASRRGFMEHAQKVAYNGDSDRGITGLFNGANVQLDNSVIDWDSATGAQIVSDVNNFLLQVWKNSAETHVPNVLLLPSDRWAQISEMRMDSGTDTTVLEFIQKNNFIKGLGVELTIKPNYQLGTAGAGGGQRMMAYELHPDNLVMKMPMPWRALAPQPSGLSVEVPAEYKFGGVEIRYPGSAAYRDFI